jgi:acetolactate synthase I/III small subunit
MKHTLTGLLQDRPGALNRAVSLFRRRGFNIESLSVAPSETSGLSRLTIVVDEPDIDRVVRQFTRLIEIIDVNEPSRQDAVVRETALVKVRTDGTTAAEVAALGARSGARVLDGTDSMMIVEITDAPDAVSEFIESVSEFGVLAVTRSGRVVMPRRVHTTAQQSPSIPTPCVPYTSQADGASDDAAA